MSRPKGAPPPGWRPTVKAKTGQGALAGIAVGGDAVLPPERYAPPLNKGLGKGRGKAGSTSATKPAEVADDPLDPAQLLGGDIENYGLWAESGKAGLCGVGADSSAAPAQHSRASGAGPTGKKADAGLPPSAAARGADYGSFFDDLDDEPSQKPAKLDRAVASQASRGRREAVEPKKATEDSGVDLGRLFDDIAQGIATSPAEVPGKVGVGTLAPTPPARATADVAQRPSPAATEPSSRHTPASAVERTYEPPTRTRAENGVGRLAETGGPEPIQQPVKTAPRAAAKAGAVKMGGNLVLDLDSHIVDVAVAWGKSNLLEGFELIGRTGSTVGEWTGALWQSGRELTEKHFEGNGIEIDLGGSHFLGSGFAELQDLMLAVKKDITITTLRLDWSSIGDAGANMLAGALLKNRTLKEVSLCENGIADEGAEAISAALDQNPSLQKLDLSRNAVGPRGAAQLASGLAGSRGLRELRLCENPLGDEGVEHLARAVDPETAGPHCALRKLGLAGCQMGEFGVAQISKAFRARGSSLVAVDLGTRGELKKTNADQEERGERFIVSCSSAGVEIASFDRSRGQIDWTQDKENINVVIKEAWLRRCEPSSVNVQLGLQFLSIEVKGRKLAEVELFGRIQPEGCSWSMDDGGLKVSLKKEFAEKWRNLTRGGGGGGVGI